MKILIFTCAYVLGILSGIGFCLFAASRWLPKPTNIGGKS